MTDEALDREPPGEAQDPVAQAVVDDRGVRARRRKRVSRGRRRILVGIGVLVLALVAGVAWLLYTGFKARTELEAVRAGVRSLRADIAAGDLSAARSDAAELRAHADRAHDLTSGPLWATAAALPYLGGPMKTTRAITAAAHSLADQALPALVRAATALDPGALRRPDGTFDIAALGSVAPQLDDATGVLARATSSIAGAPAHTWLGTVNSARSDLLGQLSGLIKSVDAADTAVAVVPPLLGADRPMTYMVTFENEAELRGTGGLPGAFAIMRAEHGKIRFVRFESDNTLAGTRSGLDFGANFNSLYRSNPAGSYVNSNMSPHFPYAARIWTAMWQRYSRQHLDGAIALDPTALSYLLAVSGPARLPDGSPVTAGNVVRLTQSEAYQRFGTDNRARKLYLLRIAKAVSKKLVGTSADLTSLVQAAGRAASESRLLVWTRDQAVEQRLAPYPISGVVPETDAPYAGMTLVNISGDKLTYYTHASFSWQRAACGPLPEVTVTIRLRNDAPTHGLPGIVTDLNRPTEQPGVPTVEVLYFASVGASVESVTQNGAPFAAKAGAERGHPVVVLPVALPIGKTQTFVIRLRESNEAVHPLVRVQPMVNPMSVKIIDECAS